MFSLCSDHPKAWRKCSYCILYLFRIPHSTEHIHGKCWIKIYWTKFSERGVGLELTQFVPLHLQIAVHWGQDGGNVSVGHGLPVLKELTDSLVNPYHNAEDLFLLTKCLPNRTQRVLNRESHQVCRWEGQDQTEVCKKWRQVSWEWLFHGALMSGLLQLPMLVPCLSFVTAVAFSPWWQHF